MNVINQELGNDWVIYQGDSAEIMQGIPNDSIHYEIFSPPFISLYTYSNSDRDMGNCKEDEQFYEQYRYLAKEQYRTLMPGRLLSFHCMDVPAMKGRDGFIGLKDFPAMLRQIYEDEGFIYHSKVTIWKDPLTEATRTKALGLMHKQLVKDSAMCRQGLPDYVITMRKPGGNPEPIEHPDGLTNYAGTDEPEAPKSEPSLKDSRKHRHVSMAAKDPVYSHHVWRKYASPVWMDINQSRTLQRESARDEKDEKHICPLQLDVIERCIQLWTNPGDTVLSPFAGIGSEGYMAVKMDRKFVGIELKDSYFAQAVANMLQVESEKRQLSLF